MIPLERENLGWSVRGRVALTTGLILLGFLLLVSRSWYLQVLHHEKYMRLATNNKVREVAESPDRGLVFDRMGRPLVTNVPTFSLALVLDDVKDLEATSNRVGELLGIDTEKIREQARKQRRRVPYVPVTVHQDLTLSQVADIEWARIPGVRVIAETRRHYPYGKAAAHLLGYVGEITEKQLSSNAYAEVLPGSRVGQYGSERTFDAPLRGVPGSRQIEVDAQGFEVREISRVPPIVGNDVYLSIDIEVQKAAEQALGDRPGAVVALDPNNGKVLALASYPAFDPEELAKGVNSKRWQEISTNRRKPMFNRVVQGTYPPGSVFKIPVAAAILETLRGGQERFCVGEHKFLDRTFRDWKKTGHGMVGLRQSLIESCDVYFYQYGDELGVDTIAKYATMFGLGQVTGIDLAGEAKGLVPSTQWKMADRGKIWYPGETLSVAIGQGYVSATPLQMADLLAAVAVNGKRFRPTIRLGVWDSMEDGLLVDEPDPLPTVALAENTYKVLKSALTGVVWDAKGTARSARSKKVTIAGKTGTAQVVSMAEGDQDVDEKDIPIRHRDHAWFAAFAPVEDPHIAVAVLVEHGGHGGSAAAPVARQVIEAYMGAREKSPQGEELYRVLEELHREREAT